MIFFSLFVSMLNLNNIYQKILNWNAILTYSFLNFLNLTLIWYFNLYLHWNGFYLFISFQQGFSELVREFREGRPHLRVRVPTVGHHPVQVLRRVVRLAHSESGGNLRLENNDNINYSSFILYISWLKKY